MSAKDIFKNILSEQSEVISELSDDTLRRYSKKSQEQIDALKSKRGRKSAKDLRTAEKRTSGRVKANNTLGDRREKKAQKIRNDSHDAYGPAVKRAAEDHGYELTHKGPKSDIYTKHEPETNTLHVIKHVHGSKVTPDAPHFHEGQISIVSTSGSRSDHRHNSYNSWMAKRHDPDVNLHDHLHKQVHDTIASHHRYHSSGFGDSSMNEDVMDEFYNAILEEDDLDMVVEGLQSFLFENEEEQLDELSKKTLGSYIRHAVDDANNAAFNQGWHTAKARYNIGDRAKKIVDNRVRNIEKATHKLAKEESEDIQELSKATLGNYIKKAGMRIHTAADISGSQRRKGDHRTSIKYDMQAIKRRAGINKAVNRLTKEEASLTEARGRPKKDGSQSEDADRPHIIMQLRKHVSTRGANPIHFADGSKHKVTDGQARLAQVLHAGFRTTQEKQEFEKCLDASHESFKSALEKKN